MAMAGVSLSLPRLHSGALRNVPEPLVQRPKKQTLVQRGLVSLSAEETYLRRLQKKKKPKETQTAAHFNFVNSGNLLKETELRKNSLTKQMLKLQHCSLRELLFKFLQFWNQTEGISHKTFQNVLIETFLFHFFRGQFLFN